MTEVKTIGRSRPDYFFIHAYWHPGDIEITFREPVDLAAMRREYLIKAFMPATEDAPLLECPLNSLELNDSEGNIIRPGDMAKGCYLTINLPHPILEKGMIVRIFRIRCGIVFGKEMLL
ncbi:hypothetical protein HGA34_04395 [Candidatus Falkowbacteria bacterium]|nr:hypothetical protein [Candidatus Falkowbacteria bacterium]